jgi:hypothetical protein
MQRHSKLLNLLDRSVRRILYHDLHFHPYKLQIIQELTAAHKALRVRCCQQMVHTHARRPLEVPHHEWRSSILPHHICKQTKLPISPTNPRHLHEWPLHSPQIVVWCAISGQGIIGPYFFQGDDSISVTVNAERYNQMLKTFLLLEMRCHN